MNPVVAIITDPEFGSPVAVRFSSADALYAWEDKNPEVVIDSMIPLVSRSEALGK